MNEQQMRYFQKLAERQNLSRTAQELVISPPALSAVIRRLEEELDCRLFDRNGRGIVLNQNGQLLLRRVNEALSALDTAREEIALARQKAETSLTVGLTSPLICHDALQAFVKQYPHIHLTHRLLRVEQLSSPTLKHEVDFIIASKDEVPDRDWAGKLIDTSAHLMLVVYPSHPFAKRDSIQLKEAAQERFIAISREYCFRRFMDKVFEMAGFSPNIILECDFALRQALLDEEYGILLTTSAIKESFSDSAVFVPITEPNIHYPRYIYQSRKVPQTKAVGLFGEFMTHFYTNRSESDEAVFPGPKM